ARPEQPIRSDVDPDKGHGRANDPFTPDVTGVGDPSLQTPPGEGPRLGDTPDHNKKIWSTPTLTVLSKEEARKKLGPQFPLLKGAKPPVKDDGKPTEVPHVIVFPGARPPA